MDEKPSLESLLHQLDSSGITLSRIELPEEKNPGYSCALDQFCAVVNRNDVYLGRLTWYQPRLGVFFLEGPGFGMLSPDEKLLIQKIYDINGGKIINLGEYTVQQLERAYKENDLLFPNWQE